MKIIDGTLLNIVPKPAINAKMGEMQTHKLAVMVDKILDLAKMIRMKKAVILMKAKIHAKILQRIVRKQTPNPMIVEHALDHNKRCMQYIARNLVAFVENRNVLRLRLQENVKIQETADGSVDSNMEDVHLVTARTIAENHVIFVS